MKFLILTIWSTAVAIVIGVSLYASELPATNLDANVARVKQLEIQLALTQAELAGLKADNATCNATLNGVMISNDVRDVIQALERTTGRAWRWDNERRRIVPVEGEKK